MLFLRSPARSPHHRLFELDVRQRPGAGSWWPAKIWPARAGRRRLSAEEQARRERQRITDSGITSFQLSPDGAPGAGAAMPAACSWSPERAAAVRPLTDAGAPPPHRPPLLARRRRASLSCARATCRCWSSATRPAAMPGGRALTTGATADRFRGLAEFVAQEEMARHEGFWWSPAGDRLLFAEVDQSGVEQFSIADPARPEREPLRFRYPRPGRPTPGCAWACSTSAAAAGAATARHLAVAGITSAIPYVARVLWDTPRAPLAVLVQTRDQRQVALLAVDPATGHTRPLVVESDPDWVNLDRDLPRWLPDGSGLLWASEASGAIGIDAAAARSGRGAGAAAAGGGAAVPVAGARQPRTRAAWCFLPAIPSTTGWSAWTWPAAPARRWRRTTPAEHAPVFARSGQRWVDTVVRARRHARDARVLPRSGHRGRCCPRWPRIRRSASTCS